MDRLTIAALHAMKREGRKIVGVVAWDTPMAELAERAGVDLISVGDSVGKNLWGHATENEEDATAADLSEIVNAMRRNDDRSPAPCHFVQRFREPPTRVRIEAFPWFVQDNERRPR